MPAEKQALGGRVGAGRPQRMHKRQQRYRRRALGEAGVNLRAGGRKAWREQC
jgi:hypothetical protein